MSCFANFAEKISVAKDSTNLTANGMKRGAIEGAIDYVTVDPIVR